MVRILCNLPLECFDDRANLRDVDLVTYGPPERMNVGGVHFPFDVAFDPSLGSIHELLAALPPGWRPDLVLLWWPDQEPLPRDLHECPVPVVGIVSDYNLSLPYTARLQPMFDVLLCDRAGVPLFEQLGHPDVRWFCQYTWKRPFHRGDPAAPRDVDVAFAGNLNPSVQRDRTPWIARLADFGSRGHRVEIHQGLDAAGYGQLLARTRVGFNRSIRGEMNLRAFEIPACGAVLMLERDNLEVRDFFCPETECVLFGDDDFEDVLEALLADEPRRARIARAGHARVQDHSLGKRLPQLLELLARRGPGRPTAAPGDAELGRAEAMMLTWASREATEAAAMAAVRRRPDDARALNTLAVAHLRRCRAAGVEASAQLLARAMTIDPAACPPALNLLQIALAWNRPDAAHWYGLAVDRLSAASDWRDVVGPVLPVSYDQLSVDWSRALRNVVATGRAQGTLALLQASAEHRVRRRVVATAL